MPDQPDTGMCARCARRLPVKSYRVAVSIFHSERFVLLCNLCAVYWAAAGIVGRAQGARDAVR